MELAVGTRLQIGPALIEVTEIRNPCYQLNRIDKRLLKAVVLYCTIHPGMNLTVVVQ